MSFRNYTVYVTDYISHKAPFGFILCGNGILGVDD